MKILMLTWEFPPFIAGGLGVACYGLVRSLLELGVEIDLVIPNSSHMYFPLRHPVDADTLPMRKWGESTPPDFSTSFYALTLSERLQQIGVSPVPEAYLTPGHHLHSIHEKLPATPYYSCPESVKTLLQNIHGDFPLFRKVREFAAALLASGAQMHYDIIHAHDWLTYPAGILLGQLTKTPMIAHIHATEFDRAGGNGSEAIHQIEYAGLSHAQQVVAVSQYTAHMVMDRYQIPADKIRVVHNAYSLSQDKNLAEKKIFKDPLILFLGRITIQKGPDYFLEMAIRILKEFKNARFVMAGSGDMFTHLLHGSAAKRLKDRFLFTGFLNRQQVESLLAATDIFVMPSISEPFGIAPLEAMAFGAVTIVSQQSGVKEIIQNAYVIDFWDIEKMVTTIIQLLKNPEERKRMSRAGQEEVLQIGWRQAAEKIHALYRETLC